MTEPLDAAYLAIIDDLEARLDVSRGWWKRLRVAEARYAALEAAARAVIRDCRVPRGDYLGDACRWCDNTIDQEGHRPTCPVGVLLPVLEDT